MEDSELKKEIIFSEKYLSSKVSEREFVHISENAKVPEETYNLLLATQTEENRRNTCFTRKE